MFFIIKVIPFKRNFDFNIKKIIYKEIKAIRTLPMAKKKNNERTKNNTSKNTKKYLNSMLYIPLKEQFILSSMNNTRTKHLRI